MTNIVRRLLEAGADASARDDKLMTPLHFAAQRGYHDAVELLLEFNADVDAVDLNMYSPLHWAAANDRSTVAEQLCEAGVSAANREAGFRIASTHGYRKIADVISKTSLTPQDAEQVVFDSV